MQITKNTVVKIDYTLFDDDGNQIDTSVGKQPLQYVHGNNMLIYGLEKQLEGKSAGDKFHAVVEPSEAYGEYDERLVLEVSRDQFEIDMPIEVGMAFQASSPNGGAMIVHVVAVTEKTVTVDGNHELAGKRLTFDVNVIEVREATEEDLNFGCGCGGCGGGCGGDCGGNCDGGCGGDCNCDGDCKCGGETGSEN